MLLLESSGLFVCLGDLFSFSVPEGQKKLLGCGLLGGQMSTQVDTMINCENMHMSARIPSN